MISVLEATAVAMIILGCTEALISTVDIAFGPLSSGSANSTLPTRYETFNSDAPTKKNAVVKTTAILRKGLNEVLKSLQQG
jgi:hypothetical protein